MSYKITGIDISKQTFDAFSVNENGGKVYRKFENNEKGYAELVKTFGKDCIYVMEGTGPYYFRLANYLYSKQIKLSTVNPLTVRRFGQMKMTRAKTDKKDAELIYEFAKISDLRLWEPPSEEIMEMRQLYVTLELYIKHRTALLNRKESVEATGTDFTLHDESLDKMIETINNEIKQIENRLYEIVSKYFPETMDLLQSIPGIGPKTATMLIIITNNFEKFTHYKQLIAYVGLSPRIFTSGSSIKGKGHIDKLGMSNIRKLLYMCSFTAKEYNKACRELYIRLKEKGKPERVIKIAIANKLLKQAFAIVKNKTFYDENYVSKFVVS